MNGQHLIYFADPMCSWCWGFSPTIQAIVSRWGRRAPVRLVMGGLRPGTTEPMTAAAKQDVRGHWDHVRQASGQPFSSEAMGQEGFVYDTDPAARAVVLARRAGSDQALAYLHAAHAAFYAQARDVTRPEVLADLAADLGLDRATFLADLASEEAKQETWRDYATSRGAGVAGFPTLVAGPRSDGSFAALSRGWQAPETILPLVEQWITVPA